MVVLQRPVTNCPSNRKDESTARNQSSIDVVKARFHVRNVVERQSRNHKVKLFLRIIPILNRGEDDFSGCASQCVAARLRHALGTFHPYIATAAAVEGVAAKVGVATTEIENGATSHITHEIEKDGPLDRIVGILRSSPLVGVRFEHLWLVVEFRSLVCQVAAPR